MDEMLEKILDFIISEKSKKNILSNVVTFDADGTLWEGDVGEEFLKWLVEKNFVRTDAMEIYNEKLKKDSTDAYLFATTVMDGLKERDLEEYCKYFFDRFFKKNIYSDMQIFVKSLINIGFDVWVLSASNKWIIQSGMQYFEIPKSNVIAMEVKIKKGILTSEPEYPLINRSGKVEAIKTYIRKKPVFSIGNSVNDIDMLEYSYLGALVINPSKEFDPLIGMDFLSFAQKKGWFIKFIGG